MYDGYDLFPDSSGYGSYLGEFGSTVMSLPGGAFLAVVGTGVIRKGSKGVMARKLQEQLKFLGYDVGTIDGDFGKDTRTQVRKFQRDKSLSVDGVVGEDTWEALSAAVKSKQVALLFQANPPGSTLPPGMGPAPLPSSPWIRGSRQTTAEELRLGIGQSGQALTPLGTAGPWTPPAVTAEQRKQRLAQVPIWNKADGVDYAVATGSGFVTGILTGALGRWIDIPWYVGALAGLGLGSGLGLAASVKLREDGK